MIELLRHRVSNPGATPEEIAACEGKLGIELPQDYQSFLIESDGFNDEVESGYLILWSIAELALADGYEVFGFRKDRFLIGSNGGRTAYAVVDGKYCSIPFVFAGDWREEIRELGCSFEQFVDAVAKGKGW